jgi:hypothetical protein
VGAGAPGVSTNWPYQFSAFVYPPPPGLGPADAIGSISPSFTVQSASLRAPNRRTYTLTNYSDFFVFQKGFATRRALDSAFTNGTYTVSVGTSLGLASIALRLRGNTYPNTPEILNWAAAHDIDASADFVLQWNPFTGASSNDTVLLDIRNVEGVLAAGMPLPATATSYTIAGGILSPGEPYFGRILFFKRNATATTTTPPPLEGTASYYRETLFSIQSGVPAPAQGRLQFSSSSYQASENDGVAAITITRTGGSDGEVSASVLSSDGTAEVDLDYGAFAESVVFAAGETQKTVFVPLLDDFRLEGNESFYLHLGNATGGAEIRDPSLATIRIMENEIAAAGTLQFTTNLYVARESNEVAVLTVVRSGGTQGAITVNYSVEGISADAGLDFAPESGTITFLHGQSRAQIRIPVIDDVDHEPAEQFMVMLEEPGSGASLGNRVTATVRIISDDLPDITGYYDVSGTIRVYDCNYPMRGPIFGSVSIDTQNGGTFRASGELFLPNDEVVGQTYNGKLTADGSISGSYTWRGSGDSGTGTFTGKVRFDPENGNSLNLTFRGKGRAYECQHSGSLSTGDTGF